MQADPEHQQDQAESCHAASRRTSSEAGMLHPSLPQARRGMGARAVAGGPRGDPDDVSRVNSGRTILKQYRETGRVTGIEP